VTRLSSILAFVMMLALGLVGGVFLTTAVLDWQRIPGSVRYGPWVAWPKAGALEADPYSRAVFARRGDIPMAPVEGLTFFASQDDTGDDLTARCQYEVFGAFPPARAWTLSVYGPDGRLHAGSSGRSAMTSAEALVERQRVSVALSSEPKPGNWLPLGGDQKLVLALRFYETPLSAVAAGLDRSRLPVLRRIACPS
jgi:hypothetical protein